MKVLTCNSNRPIAEAISAYLNLPLMRASSGTVRWVKGEHHRG